MKILPALMFIFAASALAGATPVDLTNEGVSVDVPEGWHVSQHPLDTLPQTAVAIFSASNPENTAAVGVLMCSNSHQMAVNNAAFIAQMKSTMSNSAAAKGNSVQFTSEGPIDLNGVPAYQIQDGVTLPDTKVVLCRTYLVPTHDKLYLILTQTVDPAQTPAIEAAATSFRFASPPPPPTPPISHRRLKIALLAGVVVVVLAIAAAVIFVVLRRKREEQEQEEN
jgi:hypothetical protein